MYDSLDHFVRDGNFPARVARQTEAGRARARSGVSVRGRELARLGEDVSSFVAEVEETQGDAGRPGITAADPRPGASLVAGETLLRVQGRRQGRRRSFPAEHVVSRDDAIRVASRRGKARYHLRVQSWPLQENWFRRDGYVAGNDTGIFENANARRCHIVHGARNLLGDRSNKVYRSKRSGCPGTATESLRVGETR